MNDDMTLVGAQVLAERLAKLGIVSAALGMAALVTACFAPIAGDVNDAVIVDRAELPSISNADSGIEPLLREMAGRRLIRPSQARAAVKDDGTAERLARKLKLQGVVESEGQYIAYIGIEKAGVRTVRQGEQVLNFSVDKVEPGRVMLSLEGVQIALTH